MHVAGAWLAVALVVAGCGGGTNNATLNITIDVDPALRLQTVQAEVAAPGKGGTRQFVPMSKLRWTVTLSDLKQKLSVTISAKGLNGAGAAVVTYTVMATAGPGETLQVPLKLSAACNPGPVCQADENCEEGVCAKKIVIVSGGFGGATGSGGGVGTGGATGMGSGGVGMGGGGVVGTGGAVAGGGAGGTGGAGVTTGGAPGSGGAAGAGGRAGTGGVVGSGGVPATGGAAASGGAPASGGRVGTGGAATGGAATGGANTGGAASGGSVGTGGANTGGAATGGTGTGGAMVCNPGFYGAACNHYFVGLGYPAPTHSWSQATAISSDGTTVVGSTRGSSAIEAAFRWQNGTMQGLGVPAGGDTSAAYAVNNTGTIIAGTYYQGAASFAFRWVSGVGIGALPLAEFGTFAQAYGTSGDGNTIVGYGDNDGESRSLRWINGGVSTVSSIDPLYYRTISRDGSMMGGWIANGPSADSPLPMKTIGGSAITMLNTLAGYPSGYVFGLSTTGTLAAGYVKGTAGNRAVRWSGVTATDLGMLGTGINQALGISGDGAVVVGRSGSSAFIWDGTMRSLATILTQAGVNLTGWQLNAATAVSMNGKAIVGDGLHGTLTESWIVRLP